LFPHFIFGNLLFYFAIINLYEVYNDVADKPQPQFIRRSYPSHKVTDSKL